MTFVLGYFVLLLVPVYEAAWFRCDYKYVPSIDGWLKLHYTLSSHDRAKRICGIEGGELIAPTSDSIERAMLSLIKNTDIAAVHIDFETVGRNIVPEFLMSNEIPIVENEEDRIWIMTRERTYRSSPLSALYPFICHKKAGRSVELNECGTMDDEYKLDNRTGHCYKFHRMRNTWSRALEICTYEGGNLAIINSETEAQVIRDVFAEIPPESIPGNEWRDTIFLGFRSDHGLDWKTTTGQPIAMSGYDKWAPGEPNNARGDEFCGSTCGDGWLYDNPCEREIPFICEKEIGICDYNNMPEEDKGSLSLPIPLKRIKLKNLIE